MDIIFTSVSTCVYVSSPHQEATLKGCKCVPTSCKKEALHNNCHFKMDNTSLKNQHHFTIPAISYFFSHFDPSFTFTLKKHHEVFFPEKKNKKAAPHVVWEVFDIVPLEVPKLHRPSLKVNDIKVLPNRNQK